MQAGVQKWGFSQGRRQERTSASTGQLMSTAQGFCPGFWILVFVLYLGSCQECFRNKASKTQAQKVQVSHNDAGKPFSSK